MSYESNDYDICHYGYDAYHECSFQDDYGKLNQKYQINTQLEKTDSENHHQDDSLSFSHKEINPCDKPIKNNLNKQKNKFKEKKDNFDDLTNKRELSKNELNIVKKNKDDLGRINKIEAAAKPDFSNWSEDRLKEEIKSYGIRPTSIKNMIKQLNEIWEFLNLKILSENLRKNLNEFINNEENTNDQKNNIDKKMLDAKILTVDKKVMISNLIKEEKILWTNILNFKKVDFKKIKDLVFKNGIIVEIKVLKDYLDELGIICSLDNK